MLLHMPGSYRKSVISTLSHAMIAPINEMTIACSTYIQLVAKHASLLIIGACIANEHSSQTTAHQMCTILPGVTGPQPLPQPEIPNGQMVLGQLTYDTGTSTSNPYSYSIEHFVTAGE